MANSSLFLSLLERTTVAVVMKPLDHLIYWLMEAVEGKKKVDSDNYAVKFYHYFFAFFWFFLLFIIPLQILLLI